MTAGAGAVVLLGGGFSEDAHADLDEFLLRSVGVSTPRVCFVPTASGDSPAYIARFYAAFGRLACVPSHLELFRRTERDLEGFLRDQDVLYVGGGSTANLLAVWRQHGLDEAIVRAHSAGLVLGGISAGAACWFQGCLTDSFGALAPLRDGLGLIQGSFCPHYNSESQRPIAYARAVDSCALEGGFALDDGAAARFVAGELVEIYRSSPSSNIHLVRRRAP
jgi:peptidase E